MWHVQRWRCEHFWNSGCLLTKVQVFANSALLVHTRIKTLHQSCHQNSQASLWKTVRCKPLLLLWIECSPSKTWSKMLFSSSCHSVWQRSSFSVPQRKRKTESRCRLEPLEQRETGKAGHATQALQVNICPSVFSMEMYRRYITRWVDRMWNWSIPEMKLNLQIEMVQYSTYPSMIIWYKLNHSKHWPQSPTMNSMLVGSRQITTLHPWCHLDPARCWQHDWRPPHVRMNISSYSR